MHGPGAGTSKFSIVRVEESPREWGTRLLHSSAVLGYLDCGANGNIGGEHSSGNDDGMEVLEGDGHVTALEVLRAMARQRMGPPKIVGRDLDVRRFRSSLRDVQKCTLYGPTTMADWHNLTTIMTPFNCVICSLSPKQDALHSCTHHTDRFCYCR